MSTIPDFHRTHVPKGQNHTIIVFCFLDESSFYTASGNFQCLFLGHITLNNDKVLFKGHEMTLHIKCNRIKMRLIVKRIKKEGTNLWIVQTAFCFHSLRLAG